MFNRRKSSELGGLNKETRSFLDAPIYREALWHTLAVKPNVTCESKPSAASRLSSFQLLLILSQCSLLLSFRQQQGPATRVIVFTSNGGKSGYVGYLIRPLPLAGRFSLSEVCRPRTNQPWIPEPALGTPLNDRRAIIYRLVRSVRPPNGQGSVQFDP